MVIFDANMILRYLLNDNEAMVKKAKHYLIAGNVYVTIEVIAEVVYVLKGVYKMERPILVDKVTDFLDLVDCKDLKVLHMALSTYGEHNLDFVDCVLYAYNRIDGCEIATFDKKLLQVLGNVEKELI